MIFFNRVQGVQIFNCKVRGQNDVRARHFFVHDLHTYILHIHTGYPGTNRHFSFEFAENTVTL